MTLPHFDDVDAMLFEDFDNCRLRPTRSNTKLRNGIIAKLLAVLISAGPCLPGATRLWGIISILQSFTCLYTYPHIHISSTFCSLVWFPLYPPDPKNRRQNHGAPVFPYFSSDPPKPCGTTFENWPGPPKTRGRSFKSAKTAPQDGQVDPQDPPKRMRHPSSPPRWHPKMDKFQNGPR
jgi:hypothetical protein